jgi:LysM repeat protein
MTEEGRTSAVAPDPASICPFLLSSDGTWRSASAVRDHRCTAVTPALPLAPEKQRRLCLTDQHVTCATYLAAGEARAATVHRPDTAHRPLARTTPLVLDQRRLAVALPTTAAMPHLGQGALIAVLGVAFGAVLLARLAIGGGGAPAGAVASPTPTPTATAAAVASSTPDGTPAPTPEPTPSVAPTPTLVPTEVSPDPTGTPATYKVKSGDTLSGIAAKFATTVKVLVRLNDIKDPSKIHVGQVLKLP